MLSSGQRSAEKSTCAESCKRMVSKPTAWLIPCLRECRPRRLCLVLLLLLLLYLVPLILRKALKKEFNCLDFYRARLDADQQRRIADLLATANRSRRQPRRRPSVINVNGAATADALHQIDSVPGLLSTSLGDVRIMTYGARDMYISSGILLEKDWEGPIRRRMEQLIRDSDAGPDLGLIDIGCNIGVFALTAARHGLKVVAVDANRANLILLAKSLRMNAEFNRRVILVHNALSNEYGRVRIGFNSVNIGGSWVVKIRDPDSVESLDIDGEAEAILADDLLSVVPFRRAIVKMDIEGFEHFAVAGADRLFAQLDVIAVFMEWGGQLKDVRRNEGIWAMEFMYRFFIARGFLPYSAEGLWALPSVYCFWTNDIVWRRQAH